MSKRSLFFCVLWVSEAWLNALHPQMCLCERRSRRKKKHWAGKAMTQTDLTAVLLSVCDPERKHLWSPAAHVPFGGMWNRRRRADTVALWVKTANSPGNVREFHGVCGVYLSDVGQHEAEGDHGHTHIHSPHSLMQQLTVGDQRVSQLHNNTFYLSFNLKCNHVMLSITTN